jgi:translocation and assembly module TamB
MDVVAVRNATRHAVDALRLVSDYGALSGALTLGAAAPLPLQGRIALVGDGPLRDARLDAELAGTLAELQIAARGALRGADLDGRATVTPFATSPLVRADATLRRFDAAAFDPALPHTSLALDATVLPAPDGFAGTAELIQGWQTARADGVEFIHMRSRHAVNIVVYQR